MAPSVDRLYSKLFEKLRNCYPIEVKENIPNKRIFEMRYIKYNKYANKIIEILCTCTCHFAPANRH